MSAPSGSALVEAAFDVCTALAAAGTTAVLTGGSAATYYAPEAYQSVDIDFVITVRSAAGRGEEALDKVGYRRKGDYYVHSEKPFPLEFPPGPLMIGDDHVTQWNTENRGAQVLHVLTATDSVRDRLAAYMFWNDWSGLEQALAVARAQAGSLDMGAIEAWCKRERHADRFLVFKEELGSISP